MIYTDIIFHFYFIFKVFYLIRLLINHLLSAIKKLFSILLVFVHVHSTTRKWNIQICSSDWNSQIFRNCTLPVNQVQQNNNISTSFMGLIVIGQSNFDGKETFLFSFVLRHKKNMFYETSVLPKRLKLHKLLIQ